MHIDELIDQDRRAVGASLEALAGWRADDAARPTPCEGWTVADLLAHCTVQQRGFARAVSGERTELSDWQPAPDPAPVAAYRAACAEVVAAFGRLTDPERPVLLPEIGPEPLPARLVLGFHLVDNVVHAWDLARALGRDVRLDADVLAAALAIARAVPDDARREQPGAPFKRRLPVAERSDALSETLLLLGRDPSWTAG